MVEKPKKNTELVVQVSLLGLLSETIVGGREVVAWRRALCLSPKLTLTPQKASEWTISMDPWESTTRVKKRKKNRGGKGPIRSYIHRRSTTWKVAMVVWGPIIAVALVYGIIYVAFLIPAVRIENKYDAYAASCLQGTHSGSPWFDDTPYITHGFLWLPSFSDGTVSASEIPKPGDC